MKAARAVRAAPPLATKKVKVSRFAFACLYQIGDRTITTDGLIDMLDREVQEIFTSL